MRYDSATTNGASSGRCSRTSHAAFLGWVIGAFSTASFGSCIQEHHGAICQTATVPLRLATIASFAGGSLVSGTGLWMRWLPIHLANRLKQQH